MTMPAVVLVLCLCLAGSHLASTQLRVQDAASSAARAASRGENANAIAERVHQLVPGASVSGTEGNGLVCSTVVLPAVLPGPASAITLRATACALAEFG